MKLCRFISFHIFMQVLQSVAFIIAGKMKIKKH